MFFVVFSKNQSLKFFSQRHLIYLKRAKLLSYIYLSCNCICTLIFLLYGNAFPRRSEVKTADWTTTLVRILSRKIFVLCIIFFHFSNLKGTSSLIRYDFGKFHSLNYLDQMLIAIKVYQRDFVKYYNKRPYSKTSEYFKTEVQEVC